MGNNINTCNWICMFYDAKEYIRSACNIYSFRLSALHHTGSTCTGVTFVDAD